MLEFSVNISGETAVEKHVQFLASVCNGNVHYQNQSLANIDVWGSVFFIITFIAKCY
jgi:hypothetical protein